MFFILSKALLWMIKPISLISISLILSITTKKEQYKRLSFKTGVFCLLFFSNPFIAKWAMNIWEPNSINYAELEQKYYFGIVLTGITNTANEPIDRIKFNKGADRIVHAIQLYKKGIIQKILISGGVANLSSSGTNESHELKKFAIMCGVPDSSLVIEDKARNTAENAQFTRKLLNSTLKKNHILITSAFHIRRASACFKKEGIIFTSFPTDYYGGPIHLNLNHVIIPNIQSMQLWNILIKEWVGMVAYKVKGYI